MALSCSKKSYQHYKEKLHVNITVIFIVWIVFILLEQKISFKQVCKNKDFCKVIVPSEDTKTLEFNQYQKSHQAPFVIYPDLECLIEKIAGCKYNPENPSTTKVGKLIASAFPMSTISSFKSIESKHNVYRGKDCMKKFCKSLSEHTVKIINLKRKWS